MADVNMNLYELNKVNMAKLPILTFDQENTAKDILRTFLINSNQRYYMMLCHENRDYTLFDKENWSIHEIVGAMANDIIECMHNRGYGIIDIASVPGAIEIWVREKDQEEDSHLFMFFPYDAGVINY